MNKEDIYIKKLEDKNWRVRQELYIELSTEFKHNNTYYHLVNKLQNETNIPALECAIDAICNMAHAPHVHDIKKILNHASNSKTSIKTRIQKLIVFVSRFYCDDLVQELCILLSSKTPKLVSSVIGYITELVLEKQFDLSCIYNNLNKIFNHPDKNVRSEAMKLGIEIYKKIGPSIKQYLDIKPIQMKELEQECESIQSVQNVNISYDKLNNEKWNIRLEGLLELKQVCTNIDINNDIIQVLCHRLKDPNNQVFITVLEIIGILKLKNNKMINILIERLKDKKSMVTDKIKDVLYDIRIDTFDMQLFKSKSPELKYNLLQVCTKLQLKSDDILQNVIECLNNSNVQVRNSAFEYCKAVDIDKSKLPDSIRKRLVRCVDDKSVNEKEGVDRCVDDVTSRNNYSTNSDTNIDNSKRNYNSVDNSKRMTNIGDISERNYNSVDNSKRMTNIGDISKRMTNSVDNSKRNYNSVDTNNTNKNDNNRTMNSSNNNRTMDNSNNNRTMNTPSQYDDTITFPKEAIKSVVEEFTSKYQFFKDKNWKTRMEEIKNNESCFLNENIDSMCLFILGQKDPNFLVNITLLDILLKRRNEVKAQTDVVCLFIIEKITEHKLRQKFIEVIACLHKPRVLYVLVNELHKHKQGKKFIELCTIIKEISTNKEDIVQTILDIKVLGVQEKNALADLISHYEHLKTTIEEECCVDDRSTYTEECIKTNDTHYIVEDRNKTESAINDNVLSETVSQYTFVQEVHKSSPSENEYNKTNKERSNDNNIMNNDNNIRNNDKHIISMTYNNLHGTHSDSTQGVYNNSEIMHPKQQTILTNEQGVHDNNGRMHNKQETSLSSKQLAFNKEHSTRSNEQTSLSNEQTSLSNKQTSLSNKQGVRILKEQTILKKEQTILKKEQIALKKEQMALKKEQMALKKEQGTHYTSYTQVFTPEFINIINNGHFTEVVKCFETIDQTCVCYLIIKYYIENELPSSYFNSYILLLISKKYIMTESECLYLCTFLLQNNMKDEIEMIDRIYPVTKLYKILQNINTDESMHEIIRLIQKYGMFTGDKELLLQSVHRTGRNIKDVIEQCDDFLSFIDEVEKEMSIIQENEEVMIEGVQYEDAYKSTVYKGQRTTQEVQNKDETHKHKEKQLPTFVRQEVTKRLISKTGSPRLRTKINEVRSKESTVHEYNDKEYTGSNTRHINISTDNHRKNDCNKRKDDLTDRNSGVHEDIRVDRNISSHNTCKADRNTTYSAGQNALDSKAYRSTYQNVSDTNAKDGKVFRNTYQNTVDRNTYKDPVDRNTYQNTVDRNTYQNTVDRNTYQNTVDRNTYQNTVDRNTYKDPTSGNTYQNTHKSIQADKVSAHPKNTKTQHKQILFPSLTNLEDNSLCNSDLLCDSMIESSLDNLNLSSISKPTMNKFRQEFFSPVKNISVLEEILDNLIDSNQETSVEAFKKLQDIISTDMNQVLFSANSIVSSISIQLLDVLHRPEYASIIINVLFKLSKSRTFCYQIRKETLESVHIDLINILQSSSNIKELVGDVLVNMCQNCKPSVILDAYLSILIKHNKEIPLKLIWKHSKTIDMKHKDDIQALIDVLEEFYKRNVSNSVLDDTTTFKIVIIHIKEMCAYYDMSINKFILGKYTRIVCKAFLNKSDMNISILRSRQ